MHGINLRKHQYNQQGILTTAFEVIESTYLLCIEQITFQGLLCDTVMEVYNRKFPFRLTVLLINDTYIQTSATSTSCLKCVISSLF